MRIADVIGTVTLSEFHPTLEGATWLLAVPLSTPALRAEVTTEGEPLVVYDERGAGPGSRIAIAEGPEASAPFAPQKKPINAYNTAILDSIEVE